jgi:Protein of unknown function/AsmA-like C-terminal region
VSVSWRKILAATVLGLVTAVALAAMALAWRLSEGPIPLWFLDSRIAAALSGVLPEVTARVEHTELRWARHLPELRVTGVTLLHDGETLASFPSLGILPSLRALARGQFAVHRVSLSGVRVALVRDRDGQLKLGTDRAAGGGERTVDLSALLAFGGNQGSATKFLRRIRIRHAVLSLDDRAAGTLWRADDADINVKFDQDIVVGVATTLSGTSPASGVVRDLTLPLVASAKVSSGESDGAVDFEVSANDGSMVPAGSVGAPLPIRSLAAKGAYSTASRRIDLSKLHAAIGSAAIDSTASVSVDDATAGLVLKGELSSLSIAELRRLWPPAAAASTREWIDRNIRNGAVSRCVFAIRLPAANAGSKGLPADAVNARFDFQGMTVDYVRDLAPLSEARGSGTLNAERFEGRVTGGKVAGLDVEGGLVEIRFGGGPAHLKASTDVSGPSQELLTILGQAPLGIPQQIGIPASGLGGTNRSHVEVEVPLKAGVRSADVNVKAKAELHDASLPNLLAGVGIEGGELTVQVDDRTVNVEGESGLTGLPITVGRLRVAAKFVPGPGDRDNRLSIALDGSELLANGVATLDGKVLRAVKVARLRFGGNDVGVELERRESGGYHLSIDGASMDLEPFLHAEGPTAQLARTVRVPYDAAFNLQRVSIGKGVELSVVEGTTRGEGGRFAAFNGSANLPGAGFVRVGLTEQGPAKRLEVTSNRAGNLLKAAGIFQGAEGGQLSLAATVDDRGEKARVDGQVDASNFRVTQAPVMARILSLGSLDGIASMLGGEGILVSRAQVPFTWSRDRLDIREATAVGSIGITVDGSVDQTNRTVDLRGSVFPAYTLNSMLGRIPFIGDFLVGGKGAGVFGISYRVNGKLDNPNVEANALSALAPGMLRRWFVDPFQQR